MNFGTPTPDQPSGLTQVFRRSAMERLATIIIGLGIFMLMQPFSISAYGGSFATILTGTVMFIIVSQFPE